MQLRSLAKAHIFPREALVVRFLSGSHYGEEKREIEARGVNGIGNITLMYGEVNAEIGDKLPEDYLIK
jgi:hypothetical protein